MSRHLTYEQIVSAYGYNPATGEITRNKATRRNPIGSVCTYPKRSGYLVTHYMCDDKTQITLGAHRIAFMLMMKRWPEHELDHIDGDKANNKWNNLREATKTQNRANTVRTCNNKSGYKGVCAHRGKFQASIGINGKDVYLGLYETAEEAHQVYCAKAREVFGEYHYSG